MSIDEAPTDWSIQQIAALAGTTSRTLRHYDSIGLLAPSRIAGNSYRHYDQTALVRLQRILLLRDLGLGLPAIAAVLAQEGSATAALRSHVAWLYTEQERLARLIVSVEKTIAAESEGEKIMAQDMFDGFDHTQYRDEVVQRWGKEAYDSSDAWWRSQNAVGQASWKEQVAALNADWIAAFTAREAADSPVAQELARRHVDWLRSVPGTPAAKEGGDVGGYVLRLADMYVADERFAANYGGLEGAFFVRDALAVYVKKEL